MSPDRSIDWLDELAVLWRRERAASQARFAAERRGRSLAERVDRGVALADLEMTDLAGAPGNRLLVWLAPRRPRDLSDLRVGPGDPVRLWRVSPDEPDAVLGVLSRRRAGEVGVMIDGDLPEALESGRVHLDGDDPQATFERGLRAIARFRAAAAATSLGRLRRIAAGELAPDFGREPAWTVHDAELDEPQRAAVGAALAARDVALIHGPPGTGKTRVLVEVVRQLVLRGERVLIAAASNAAVDHLAGQVAAHGISVLRLGHPARVDPALEELTLDAQLERDGLTALARGWLDRARELRRRASRGTRAADRSAIRALRDQARELERDARRQLATAQEVVLARARVVAATCAGSDAVALGDTLFDTTVIDEATQAPDPIALVALARSPRAVLAGDPHQLPPTVLDVEAARRGLGVTAFERIATGASLLVTQHRMHADIMAFPSRSKYGGLLRAAPEVAAHRLEDLGTAADPLRPGVLVFIDTAGTGWSEERGGDDPSTSNPAMAARTAAEVRRLLSRGVAPGELAVITPYVAQVRLLRGALAGEVASGLEIDTVDGFQGREKEAVVVDLVRSNDDGEIGFLADTRRMNVALTRARRFLLVVGDSATLAGHPYYAAFLAAVSAHGQHLSAWSDEAPPLDGPLPSSTPDQSG
jgi:ATP-dependent RNA/DNA helicase IGHMBP2